MLSAVEDVLRECRCLCFGNRVVARRTPSPKTVSHCAALLFWLLNFETSTLDLETCTLKFPRRGATRDRER